MVVVGVGRCGTSTTARILHDKLGVRMVREVFIKPDKWNPQGYYEDRQVKSLQKQVMRHKATAAQFADAIQRWYDYTHSPWGFKLVVLQNTPADILSGLKTRLVIACMRQRKATVDSMHQWRNWRQDLSHWANVHDERFEATSRMLHGHRVLWLDFSEKRGDEELTEIIGQALM